MVGGANGQELQNVDMDIKVSTLRSMKAGYSRGHSPVVGGTANDDAKAGHAEWIGNTLRFSGEGRQNYWYIPAAEDMVSFCVLIPDMLRNGGYVVSDSYAGCEYHEVVNNATMELGFLHVYRGVNGPVKYTLGPGWTLMKKNFSMELSKRLPTKANNPNQRDGSILSISYIHPCQIFKDFVAQSDFICMKDGMVTHTLSQIAK
mgnify:CR=1 FL=1